MAAYFCADGRAHACSSALTGQLSLGHAALMAVGGYGYALTANALPVRRRPALRARAARRGARGVGVVGLLLGLAAARLSRAVSRRAHARRSWSRCRPSPRPGRRVLRGDQGLQIPFDGVPDGLRRVIALEQWQAWVAVVVAAVVVTG